MNAQTYEDPPTHRQLARAHTHTQVLGMMLWAGLPWGSPRPTPLGLVPWASIFGGKARC